MGSSSVDVKPAETQEVGIKYQAQLWNIIYGFADSLILRCIVKIGIPDIIKNNHGSITHFQNFYHNCQFQKIQKQVWYKRWDFKKVLMVSTSMLFIMGTVPMVSIGWPSSCSDAGTDSRHGLHHGESADGEYRYGLHHTVMP
ncbi:hypothetical protein MKX03_016658 [Papaver bracteatum]|nr:hypothetical protein MKX03_016658 [Papaver bracteatum]